MGAVPALASPRTLPARTCGNAVLATMNIRSTWLPITPTKPCGAALYGTCLSDMPASCSNSAMAR